MQFQQQPQSIEEIKDRERRSRTLVARILYNARDTPAAFSQGGVPYTIPPDGPSSHRYPVREGISKPGLVVDKGTHAIYDGTLAVFNRYGVEAKVARQYRKKLKQGRNVPTPFADKLIAEALDIVQHALKKLGPAGVVMLTGDPQTDADLKKEAKALAIEFKRAQCERALKNYRERTDAFYRDPRNKGNYAPAMDDHELAAQSWLDEYRLGKKNLKRYPCPENCGFGADDVDVIATHLMASHPMVADQHMKTLESAAAATVPVQADVVAAGTKSAAGTRSKRGAA